MARDVARYTIVLFPVWTLGFRMICMPFETASIPVYVPAPIENARKKMASNPTVPTLTRPV